MSLETSFSAGPVACARIAPKECPVPLSVILMPPPETGARFGVPEWTHRGTRPPFPGQKGIALVPFLAAAALGLAVALGAAGSTPASSPDVALGLGNLRSPRTTDVGRDVVVPGAPQVPTLSPPSSALAGWHRERFSARRGDTFSDSIRSRR